MTADPGDVIARLTVAGIVVEVWRAATPDAALVVQIETPGFEPDGSDGRHGLRVRVNEADVTECGPEDFVPLQPDPGDEDLYPQPR